jgi:hypothetical protein
MVAIGLSCGGCLSCGGGCVIASDNFNRSDADDINDGAPFEWGGDNGNIQIFDNEIIIFSGTPEQLTCPTANPDSTGSGYVTATFRADAGDEVEVWLNGSDADNCTVARLTVGSPGTLEIIDRTSGSDTSLESVSTSTSAYDSRGIALYYDAATKIAKAVSGDSVCAFSIDEKGYLAGISIGSNSGAVYIDDFSYQKLGDGENGCPELTGCDVDPCSQDVNGWESVLTISGVTNGSCNDCATALNNSFVLPVTPATVGSQRVEFKLEELSSTDVCATIGGADILFIVNTWCDASEGASLGIPSPTQYGIRVFIRVNRSGFTTSWDLYKNLGTDPPNLVDTYTGFTLRFFGNTGGWCSYTTINLSVSFSGP